MTEAEGDEPAADRVEEFADLAEGYCRGPRRRRSRRSAALEIARAVEAELQSELGIGLGLNSGTVVAGNVGRAGRLEFSVIGDVVNVAARVESPTRKTGDVILVSKQTKQRLRRGDVPLVARPDVRLKGKTQAVALYTPEDGVRRSPGAPS